ncbi:hypothetical protein VTL71DRAFT_8708 [Oculimacula yallundae]|uniref:Uncharacterized protein n=1 Tax=Oculimacula yallundae TaxID=86028 RepID=A0ABR4CYD0_9HELO
MSFHRRQRSSLYSERRSGGSLASVDSFDQAASTGRSPPPKCFRRPTSVSFPPHHPWPDHSDHDSPDRSSRLSRPCPKCDRCQYVGSPAASSVTQKAPTSSGRDSSTSSASSSSSSSNDDGSSVESTCCKSHAIDGIYDSILMSLHISPDHTLSREAIIAAIEVYNSQRTPTQVSIQIDPATKSDGVVKRAIRSLDMLGMELREIEGRFGVYYELEEIHGLFAVNTMGRAADMLGVAKNLYNTRKRWLLDQLRATVTDNFQEDPSEFEEEGKDFGASVLFKDINGLIDEAFELRGRKEENSDGSDIDENSPEVDSEEEERPEDLLEPGPVEVVTTHEKVEESVPEAKEV